MTVSYCHAAVRTGNCHTEGGVTGGNLRGGPKIDSRHEETSPTGAVVHYAPNTRQWRESRPWLNSEHSLHASYTAEH